MKTRTKIGMLTAAGLIAAAQLSTPAFADEPAAAPVQHAANVATATEKEKKPETETETKNNRILRSSEEAFQALRDAQAARLAIFNGEPTVATELTAAAFKNLKAAAADGENLAVDTKKAKSNGDHYIPIDTSMALTEGYEPTETKAEKLKEANQHIAKSDEKKAAEVLKLANIDITLRSALLPIDASIRHATDAVKLLEEKHYYEANLALKAIEDSIVVDYFGIEAVPAQGKAG